MREWHLRSQPRRRMQRGTGALDAAPVMAAAAGLRRQRVDGMQKDARKHERRRRGPALPAEVERLLFLVLSRALAVQPCTLEARSNEGYLALGERVAVSGFYP